MLKDKKTLGKYQKH